MSEHDLLVTNEVDKTEEKGTKISPVFDFTGINAQNIIDEANSFLPQEDSRLNEFPVYVFPVAIQKIIKATNESLNFPIDFIGASMLFAASVAIGNTHKAELTRGFQETATLYIAIVARAGTNKSAPLRFALQPIFSNDKKTYQVYKQQRAEYDALMKLNKKEREEKLLDEPVEPSWEKYILSDFTPEALTQVHKSNRRGIGVYVDELAGWFKNFNRYNKGSEMEFWLSAWSGTPINIDRKSGEPVFISLPFISVAGTIQNSLLNDLAKESRSQNGFMDRMLFVIPDNVQKPHWSENELQPGVVENWRDVISKILNISIDFDDTQSPIPEILRFNPEAKEILLEWQGNSADYCNKPENEHLSGIYSKLETYAIRIALILEVLEWSCNQSIKKEIGVIATKGALKLIEYFKLYALKVHSVISNASPLDKLPLNKRNLYESLPESFTTEKGVEIAIGQSVPERTFKRFLKDRELFRCISRGEYEKQI